MAQIYVSSTQISSVIHLNKHKSKRMLWYEKKGIRKERSVQGNQAVDDGVALEETAINVALDIIDPGNLFAYFKPGIVVDPWSKTCCSPDLVMGLWHLNGKGPTLVGLEVKVPHTRGIPESITDVPIEYIIQCFVSIHITKAEFWYLFFYNKHSRSPGSDALFIVYPNAEIWSLVNIEVYDFIKSLERDEVPQVKNRSTVDLFSDVIKKGIIIKKVVY